MYNQHEPPTPSLTPEPEDGGLLFENVYEWVDNFLTELYPRDLTPGSGNYWCEKWWEHIDAHYRLNFLWLAWEDARNRDITSPITWIINYADPIMNHLLSEHGPFKLCRTGESPIHRTPDNLPTNKDHQNGQISEQNNLRL